MTRKILFVGFDDFSHINKPLEEQLIHHFPNWSIRYVTLKPKLKKRRFTLALAFGYMVWELGGDFLRGYKKWWKWRNHFYSTGFMVRTLSEMARQEVEKDTYAFTLQTQSLFKCTGAIFGTFLYTDHTNLNNLNYPHIQPQEYLASRAFRDREREIYLQATTVFVMSENIRRSLIEQYKLPQHKVELVYAGADNFQTEVNPEKFKSKNIIFTGKDWVRKGGPLLLTAFEQVLRKIPDATLTIIGCQPDTHVPNCRILGVLPKDQVMAEFNRAAVFCLPTRREPFGMVFIEAMFNHLPVVCTAVGATPELVEDGVNGFLIPNDAHVLAERLIYLLENPRTAETFAIAGFNKVSQRYTWNKVGERMAATIHQAIPSRMDMPGSKDPASPFL